MDIKKRLPHEVCYDAADEILRQRAEIERLRSALEWITEHHDVQAMLTKAREALRVSEQLTK